MILELSQIQIDKLINEPKTVKNPTARDVQKPGHTQKNYLLESKAGNSFSIYMRQNNKIEDDFSCGLMWNSPSGETVTLVRYNGSSHQHGNRLEDETLDFECHIHKARSEYLEAGLKIEGFAQATSRYHRLEGALYCLVEDCNIQGINPSQDEPKLF